MCPSLSASPPGWQTRRRRRRHAAAVRSERPGPHSLLAGRRACVFDATRRVATSGPRASGVVRARCRIPQTRPDEGGRAFRGRTRRSPRKTTTERVLLMTDRPVVISGERAKRLRGEGVRGCRITSPPATRVFERTVFGIIRFYRL